ncbi:MAG: hypothetical protein HQ581_20640 [Planctomycetes bacterium]|nr:hypothetical protein [Planctomycetota bacterium]
MSHTKLYLGAILILTVAWLSYGETALAAPQDDAPEPTDALSSGEKAIRQVLRRKATIRCKDAPLDDVVAALRQKYRIVIDFDWNEIEKVLGIVPSETRVSCDCANVPLRSALELMLEPLELTWVIDKDVLLITTKERADQMLNAKVHDVADLVMFRNGQGRTLADYDSLEQLIMTSVRPDSWEEVGGPGTISHLRHTNAESLVVCQTMRVHEELEKLLANLRAIAEANRQQHGDALPPLELSPELPQSVRDTGLGSTPKPASTGSCCQHCCCCRCKCGDEADSSGTSGNNASSPAPRAGMGGTGGGGGGW